MNLFRKSQLIAIALIFCLSYLISGIASHPCNPKYTIDISKGKHFKNGSILHKRNLYTVEDYFKLDNGSERGCVCKKKACMSKCCAKKHYQTEGFGCTHISGNLSSFQVLAKINSSRIHIFYFDSIIFEILDGEYKIDEKDGSFYDSKDRYDYTKGCFDVALNNETLEVIGRYFGEFPQDFNSINQIMERLTIAGLYISAVFLFVTLCVYLLLPELRNIHGKCVMNLILSLCIAMSSLATTKITGSLHVDYIPKIFCMYTGLVTYFFWIASFVWMNILCIDVYFTFIKDFMISRMSRRSLQSRRFRYYLAYGWLTPTVAVVLLNIFQYVPIFKDVIVRANIGETACWFSVDTLLYYLYYPISIIIGCNVLLFLLTAFQMIKINRQTCIIRNCTNNTSSKLNGAKNRFIVILKLFIVMGITWVTEILGTLIYSTSEFWFIADSINMLCGVFIFFIFVWNQKTRSLLKRRLAQLLAKPPCDADSSFRRGTTKQTLATESVTDQSVILAQNSVQWF